MFDIDRLINHPMERKFSGRNSGGGSDPIGVSNLTEEITNLQNQYNELTASATSQDGLIIPDETASGITQDDIMNKEFEMLNKINNSSAMVLAGLYSQLKTGNAQAFNEAMAYRGKTMEDMTNLKSYMNTVASPTASRSSKIAASAALSRNFGIDAAKDYNQINTAVLGLKQLQGQFAERLLGKSQGLMQSLIKTTGKAETRKTIPLSTIKGLYEAMKDAYKSSEDASDRNQKEIYLSTAQSISDILTNLKEYDVADKAKEQ